MTKKSPSKSPEKHSPTGASTMHRWEACPGSIRLCDGIPNPSSGYAEEGTRAHEALADYLTTGEFKKGVPLDVVEAVMVFINAAFEDERSVLGSKGVKKWVEHGFDLSSLYHGLYGTADYVAYYPASKLLQVWDYKHGQGIGVEPRENEQLMYYGLGALLTLNQEMSEGVENVELIIGQPRKPHSSGPIRRWATTAQYLREVFAKRLVKAVKDTEKKDAKLIAGEHCRFCPAGRATVCPEIHNKALRLAQSEFAETSKDVASVAYDPQKLSEVLVWIPTLTAWINGVSEFAQTELKAGKTIPGFKLVKTFGRRKWRDGITSDVLSMELGLDTANLTETSILSPAQVEKLVGKKERPLIDQLTTTGAGGVTMAREDDSRPSALIDAATEFKQLAIEANYSLLD